MAVAHPISPSAHQRTAALSVLTLDRWFLAIAISILLVSQYLASSIYLIESDEAVFGACAVRQLVHAAWPLTSCVDIKPPGIFVVYDLVYRIFGPYSAFGMRLAAVVAMLFAAGTIGNFTRQISTIAASHVVAGMFLLICAVSPHYVALKTEIFSISFVFLAMSATWTYQQRRHRRFLVLAGVAVAAATLFKQPAILMIGACSISLVLPRPGISRWQQIKDLAWLGVGLVVPLAMVAILYAACSHGTDFLQQMWQRPYLYATHKNTSASIWQALLMATLPLRLPVIVAALFAFGMITRQNRDAESAASPGVSIVLLPYAIIACLIVSLGKHFFPSYFLFLWPYVLIPVAHAFRTINSFSLSGFLRRDICGAAALGSGLVLAATLSIDQLRHLRDSDTFAHQIASQILSHGEPRDQIYVWGYVPELYVATKRTPASRFVVSSMLFGYFHDTSEKIPPYAGMKWVQRGDWDRFMADLRQAGAFLLVDTSSIRMGAPGNFRPQLFPRMKNFMTQHCTYKATVEDFPVYRCGDR